MTRHELKEQLQHDQFTDAVSGTLEYASSHRRDLIRWSIVGVVVLILAGGFWWYRAKQTETRRAELSSAMSILDAQIGPSNEFAKTYPTEAAKNAAWNKAISNVADKYNGTPEGWIAQYYRGASRAQKDDLSGAENDLRTVANSSSSVASLAKIALAQLYIGEKKTSEARNLLQDLVRDPSPLVSKAQAQILQAQLSESANPQAAKDALKTIDAADRQRAAVKRAADDLNSQLAK